jgi:hypothetical protein
VESLLEYLNLLDLLESVVLQEGVPDKHIWRLSSSETYSAKSAYGALFEGSLSFAPYERIWKSSAPPKCHFFMWLVAHDRCWTTDKLARRGLPHPDRCLLCDQEEESVQHLLLGCVFARQFWLNILQSIVLASLAPQLDDPSFDEWWDKSSLSISGDERKGLNSLIILGAWSL